MGTPLVFLVAYRQLFSRAHSGFLRTVSVLSVCGLGIGVAALLVLDSFMTGFRGSIMDALSRINPPIIVTAPGSSGLQNSDLEYVSRLAGRTAGLGHTCPMLENTAIASGRGGEVAGIMVRGVDWEDMARTTLLDELVGESYSRGLIIGEPLAERMGVAAGDTLRLASAENALLSGMGSAIVDTIIHARIGSVVDMGIDDYNTGMVVMDIETARALFRSGVEATSVGVAVAGSEADPVREAVKMDAALRDGYVDSRHGRFLSAQAFIQRHENLFRALGLEHLAMTVVLALITVVALLNLSSALAMIALEHRRDLGVMRAMGASPGFLARTSLLQGGLIGTMGASGGVAFSVLLIYLANNVFQIRLESSIYWVSALPGRFQPEVAGLIAACTVLACLLAALFPALTSLSVSPSEAVRYE
jgi:lipoprotein-releasing system permease protein